MSGVYVRARKTTKRRKKKKEAFSSNEYKCVLGKVCQHAKIVFFLTKNPFENFETYKYRLI